MSFKINSLETSEALGESSIPPMDKNILKLEFQEEKLEDFSFREIKILCFSYLDDGDLSNFSIEELKEYKGFLGKKFDELSRVKNALKIKTEYHPFTEISYLLSKITLKNDIEPKQEEVIPLLTKDIGYVMESISFCYLIIEKMVKELSS